MQVNEEVRGRLLKILKNIRGSDPSLISKAICGRPLAGLIGFEASALGVKYRVMLENDTLKVDFYDPLNKPEDSNKIFTYMLNALERVLAGNAVGYEGGLTKIARLPGGSVAHLYETRITNFIAAEMEGASVEEVEEAARNIGGTMVEHPNATWSLEVAPFNGVRFRIIYWEGEEGIPPNASILVGEEVKETNMPIQELIIIIEMAANRLIQFYRKATNRKPRLFESLYL